MLKVHNDITIESSQLIKMHINLNITNENYCSYIEEAKTLLKSVKECDSLYNSTICKYYKSHEITIDVLEKCINALSDFKYYVKSIINYISSEINKLDNQISSLLIDCSFI